MIDAPMKELLTLRGCVDLILFDWEGAIKQKEHTTNLIVTQGRDSIIEQLETSPTAAKPLNMAVGTGAAAPAAGDTNITFVGTRQTFTSALAAANVFTMIATFAAGNGTGALTEAAVFSTTGTSAGATATPMYSRATFTVINKAAGDSLEITWTYTLSAT